MTDKSALTGGWRVGGGVLLLSPRWSLLSKAQWINHINREETPLPPRSPFWRGGGVKNEAHVEREL